MYYQWNIIPKWLLFIAIDKEQRITNEKSIKALTLFPSIATKHAHFRTKSPRAFQEAKTSSARQGEKISPREFPVSRWKKRSITRSSKSPSTGPHAYERRETSRRPSLAAGAFFTSPSAMYRTPNSCTRACVDYLLVVFCPGASMRSSSRKSVLRFLKNDEIRYAWESCAT